MNHNYSQNTDNSSKHLKASTPRVGLESSQGHALPYAIHKVTGLGGRVACRGPRQRCAIKTSLEAQPDASWASKHSTLGGIVMYRGCLIVWWSRLQKSISASATEAEYFAAALASREGVYVRDLLEDLGYSVTRRACRRAAER